MDEIRQSVRLSSVEMHLVAHAIGEQVAKLDAQERRIRTDIENAPESWSGHQPALSNIHAMRGFYAAISRQIENVLEVPFLTSQDARVVLEEVGIVFVGGDPLVAA